MRIIRYRQLLETWSYFSKSASGNCHILRCYLHSVSKFINCVTDQWNVEEINKLSTDYNKVISLLMDELGVTKITAVYLVHQAKKVNSVCELVCKHNLDVIRDRNWSVEDVLQTPKVLVQRQGFLSKRIEMLAKNGFINDAITIKNAFKCRQLLREPLSLLLHRNYINSIEKHKKMLSDLNCPVNIKSKLMFLFDSDNIQDLSLSSIQKSILLQYLSWKLNASVDELMSIMKKYPALKNKSCLHFQENISVLVEQFGMPVSKIKSNAFLMITSGQHFKEVFQTHPFIAGVSIKEIGNKYPRILTTNVKRISESIKILHEFNLSDKQIRHSFNVITFGPQNLRKRLLNIHAIPEFKVMLASPRILYAVYFHNKAIARLEYLKAIGYESTSLDLLICSNSNFRKTIPFNDTVQSISLKGKELLFYLASIFNKTIEEVKEKLAIHPNHTKKCSLNGQNVIAYLIKKGISSEVIFNSLYITLYDIKDIENILQSIESNSEIENYLKSWKNSPYVLEFVIYCLERDVNFSGDAIWTAYTGHWTKEDHSDTTTKLTIDENCYKRYGRGMDNTKKLTIEQFLGID